MRSQAVRPMSQNCFVIGPDERDEIGMDESQDATSYFAGEAYRWSYPKDQHLPQPPLSPGAVSLGSPSIMSDDGTGMTPLLPQSRPSFSSLRDHQTYGTCRERATGLGLYISDDDAVASGALRLRQPHTEPGSPTVVDISPTTMSSGAGGGLELPTDQQGGSHLSSSQASRSFNDSAMAASVRLSSSHSKGVSVVDPNVPVIRTVHTAD